MIWPVASSIWKKRIKQWAFSRRIVSFRNPAVLSDFFHAAEAATYRNVKGKGMKRAIALAAILLALGSSTVMAQNDPANPANAGNKPGQGTTPANEDHSQHKNMGASTGSSSGAAGTADSENKAMPPANGKGVTPNSNSGGAKQ